MSVSKGPSKFSSVLIRNSAPETLSDAQRATYVPSLISKEKFNTPGYPVFNANIVIREKPIWRYTLDLDWNTQIGPMLTALGKGFPNTAAEHDEAALDLARELRVWGRDNLKGQICVDIIPAFVAQMRVLLERKSDLVKFKLAWWSL